MPTYVQIAVNVPQVANVFDYHVPPELYGQIAAGHLVVVPFGRQTVQGVVLRSIPAPAYETKAVLEKVDEEPVLTAQQIELAEWLAQTACAGLAECIRLMLPPGLSKLADLVYTLDSDASGGMATATINETQERILHLLRRRGALRGRQLEHALPRRNWRSSAQKLVRLGVVKTQNVLGEPSVRPRTVRTVRLVAGQDAVDAAFDSLGRAGSPALIRRQAMLRALLREKGSVEAAWLYAESAHDGKPGCLADLHALEERGLIALADGEVLRDPMAAYPAYLSEAPQLVQEQTAVWEVIRDRILEAARRSAALPKPILLHGVTGSGKTEIYLRAVAETLGAGRQAIVMVPEISLTPQTVRRFLARFPGKVGLVHSRLSDGERYDTWRRARRGDLPVIVGARSALFTPLPKLGLIVVDEFHDDSYYQSDPAPAYHAVGSAVAYACKAGAVCILGSATPDIVSYRRAAEGEWQLLHLPERILAHRSALQAEKERCGIVSHFRPLDADAETMALPPVRVVDMRAELKEGNRSIFSRALLKGLEGVLAEGHQAILFLNRRGSATYVFCRACGHVLRCPHCDIPLVYHAPDALSRSHTEKEDYPLRCHHCNYQRRMPARCPQCASPYIRQYGTGTQKVEEEVQRLFPQARTLRWDWDTTRQKGAHDAILDAFTARQADVLIGTQMLAKGLDLPLVTLVGVVLADVGLTLPDYRAAERVFALLAQVGGRAGRSPLGGEVILQTFMPDHYVIQAAAQHDYRSFYEKEIEFRRSAGYPPFSHLVRLEMRGLDNERTEDAVRRLAVQVKEWIEKEKRYATQVIGPAPCFFARVGGQYRWHVTLNGPDPLSLLRGRQLKEVIVEVDPPNLL